MESVWGIVTNYNMLFVYFQASPSKFKSPAKPIFNKEGKMVFSKFDFSESPEDKKEAENLPTGSKKYKKLLEKVEQRKQKLSQVGAQYSRDNLTFAYLHNPDNSHNLYSHTCMLPH